MYSKNDETNIIHFVKALRNVPFKGSFFQNLAMNVISVETYAVKASEKKPKTEKFSILETVGN